MGLDASIWTHLTHAEGMFQPSVLVGVSVFNVSVWLCLLLWRRGRDTRVVWWLALLGLSAVFVLVGTLGVGLFWRRKFFWWVAVVYWNGLWLLPLQGMFGLLWTGRRKDWIAWLLTAAALGVGAYALLIEPQQLHLRTRTIPISGLPRALHGLRILHITDVQTDDIGSRERKVSKLIAQNRPDLIVLTGDYITMPTPASIQRMQQWFASMRAPLGVYAVNGDYNLSHHHHQFWKGTPVQNLSGRSILRKIRGKQVFLAGIDRKQELRHPTNVKLPHAPPQAALRILLSHGPDIWDHARQKGYHVVFAGHTHGGQVVMPFFGPLITLTRLGRRYARGLFYRAPTWLHVSSGMGYEGHSAPRIRFLCPPEVVLLTLHAS